LFIININNLPKKVDKIKLKMFSKNNPFSSGLNTISNDIFFKNQNQDTQRNNDDSDYFSIQNNPNQNLHAKTKEKFTFYSKGTPSQIKQCLDYFMNQKDKDININLVYITNSNNPIGLSNEFKSSKISNPSNDNEDDKFDYFNIKQSNKNADEMNKIKNSQSNKGSLNEDDSECAAPPCKRSNNSCISGNTLTSSRDNTSNSNYFNSKYKEKFDSIANDVEHMQLNEKYDYKNNNYELRKNHNNKYPKKFCLLNGY